MSENVLTRVHRSDNSLQSALTPTAKKTRNKSVVSIAKKVDNSTDSRARTSILLSVPKVTTRGLPLRFDLRFPRVPAEPDGLTSSSSTPGALLTAIWMGTAWWSSRGMLLRSGPEKPDRPGDCGKGDSVDLCSGRTKGGD